MLVVVLMGWCAIRFAVLFLFLSVSSNIAASGLPHVASCHKVDEDFFLSCPRYFFPHLFSASYLLPLFHCLISILLFPCAGVWENTRA